MSELKMVRTIGDRKIFAKWYGGEYIGLGLIGHGPVEVINVWDYEKGETTVPFTRKGMKSAVDGWIADYGKEELAKDITENWIYY